MTTFTPISKTDMMSNPATIMTALLPVPITGLSYDLNTLNIVSGTSSLGFYDGSLTALGIGAGLLLTSGTMPGASNTVGYFGVSNNMSGDPDLDAVVNTVFNTQSLDATTLSFNFTVTDPTITGVSFNIVFGSDEFPEWVNQFVDIGVVLINGVNVALFNHDPMAPLSVIGSNLASGYFINNLDGHLPIEYDGISAPMTVFAPVHMGVNTLKIGVADTRDHIYDSGLFISGMTGTTIPVSGITLDIDGSELEDDIQGTEASESVQSFDGNDTINAAGGDDIIQAGLGDDKVNAGTGNNYYDGGDGLDTALYGGLAEDYSIVGYTDGMIKIKQLAGGLNASSDLLVNVELAQFADITLDLSSIPMTATPEASLIGASTSSPSVIAADVTSVTTTAAIEDGESITVDVLANATNGETFVTDVANNLANLPAGVAFDALTNTLTLDPSDSAYQDLSTSEIQTVTVYYGLTTSIDDIAPVTTVGATFTITGSNDAPVVSEPVTFNVQEDLGVESVAPLSGEVEVVETEIELELKDLAEKDSLASGNLPNSVNLLSKAIDIDHLDSLSVVDLPTVLPSGIKYIHLDAQTLPSTLYYGAPTVIPAIDALVIDPSDTEFQNLAKDEVTTLSINYGVSDGTVTTPATAIFNVTGTNDAPLVSGLLSATSTEENSDAVVVVDALALASDIDHNAVLSVIAAPPGGAEDFGGLTEIGNPADDTVGSLIFSANYDGTPVSLSAGVTLDTETNRFNFNSADPVYDSLSQDEIGRVVINYGVTDGIVPVATSATALFTVIGSNDAPVVSGTMTHTVQEGNIAATSDNSGFDLLEIEALEDHGVTATQIPNSINLLGNASDVDHLDKLSVVNLPVLPNGIRYIHTDAYSSSIDYYSAMVEHPAVDALIIDPSDAAFQSLAEGDVQTMTINYGISDGIATVSNQVEFTVLGTNDAPAITVPASANLLEDAVPVTVDALANAIDVDHDAVLSVVDVPTLLPAGISYDTTTHLFAIDTSNPVFQELAQGEIQTYSVGYGVSDGMVTTLTNVNFNVEGVNDVPIISGSVTGSPNEDGQIVSVNATGNAVDVDDHQGLQVTDIPEQLPAGVSYDGNTGRFSLDPTDAAYQYLAKGETVDISVAYNIFDGYVTLPTSVIFTVTGKNDVPVVSAIVQGGTVSENDTAQHIDLLANTTDVDHLDLLAVKQGQGLEVATSTLGAIWSTPINFSIINNQLTVDPAQFNALRADEKVDITFSYTVTDGSNQGGDAIASADLTVVGKNDAPTSITLSATHLIENTVAGTSVAQFSTLDSDRNESFTYQLFDPKGLFAIKGNTLVVAEGAVINYETNQSDSIQVQVTDSAGATLTQSFTIGIDNISGVVITGSSKNDVFNATSLVATTSEEDTVDGKNGNDIISSLAGNDTIIGGTGNDSIDAGEGDDTLIFTGSDAQGDVMNAGSTGEVKGDTVLIQGKGAVTLTNFNAGLSSIENWLGNNSNIIGTGSADKIDLSYLKSLTGLSFIDAGSGNDNIVGSTFADNLRGGADNDLINGSAGNDSLTGGAGVDTFVFNADFGKDTINDFVGSSVSGHDIIRLDQTQFTNFAAVQASMSQVGTNVVIVSETNTITLVGVSLANVVAVDFTFN